MRTSPFHGGGNTAAFFLICLFQYGSMLTLPANHIGIVNATYEGNGFRMADITMDVTNRGKHSSPELSSWKNTQPSLGRTPFSPPKPTNYYTVVPTNRRTDLDGSTSADFLLHRHHRTADPQNGPSNTVVEIRDGQERQRDIGAGSFTDSLRRDEQDAHSITDNMRRGGQERHRNTGAHSITDSLRRGEPERHRSTDAHLTTDSLRRGEQERHRNIDPHSITENLRRGEQERFMSTDAHSITHNLRIDQRKEETTTSVPNVPDRYTEFVYTWSEPRGHHDSSNKTFFDNHKVHDNFRQEEYLRQEVNKDTVGQLRGRPGKPIARASKRHSQVSQSSTPKGMMAFISEMMAEATGKTVLSDSFSGTEQSEFHVQRVPSDAYSSHAGSDTDAGIVESESYQGELIPKPRPETAGSQEPSPDATLGLLTSHPHGKPKKPIFCYYGTSANARPSVGKFWPENVDPFLCTHLIFAFADITEDGTSIKPNNWNDLGENGLYSRTIRLKEKNSDLKILLAVGGWKIGSKPFLPVIESSETWRTWISNVIEYLRRFDFDGLDMDWEFPGWRGSGPQDRHKFTLFMKDMHDAFAAEAESSGKPRLVLTLATAASAFYVEKAYEPTEIHKHVDYMLLMTYNFHGSGWEKYTGHHTPLLPHPLDPEGEQRELYVLWAINYWLNYGVPRSKIVMGMAAYGLGWKLTDPSNTGVRAPADGGNTKGKYTEESGILSHYEICEHVLEDGWNVEWIDEQKAPYAYGDNEWVGFDSPDSYYVKAVTVLQEGLAGAFIWSVEMDDFNGHCGGPKFPLIRTVYEVFTQHPLSSSSSPSSSAQLRVVSNTPGGHSQDEGHEPHSHISSSAATHSHAHHGGHGTPAHSASAHLGSISHSGSSETHHSSSESHHSPSETHHSLAASHHSPSTFQHSSDSTQHHDYHYEFDPDVDGHLSKPWQPMTEYDYEYYSWGDESDSHTEEHSSPSAAAASHTHETASHDAAHLVHDISSDYHHDYTGHYEHDEDADGHLSKPWQAKSDYDYEYYDWGDEHSHSESESVSSSASITHEHGHTTHEDQHSEDHHNHGDYHDRHHHGDELAHVDCNSLGPGIHPSMHSCHHFVLCVPINGHEFGPSIMSCPSGTLYDDSLKVCNHQHLVHCYR